MINFENMIKFELFDPVFNFQHTQLLKFFSTNVGPGFKFQYKTNNLVLHHLQLMFPLGREWREPWGATVVKMALNKCSAEGLASSLVKEMTLSI